jgi:CRISPR-associated protein Csb2
MPWHAKRHFGVGAQIRRELFERQLISDEATAEISELRAIDINGRPRRPIHFRRFRSKRGLVQPDKIGCFVSLKLPVAITGPLALGFACHFGLGLFRRQ